MQAAGGFSFGNPNPPPPGGGGGGFGFGFATGKNTTSNAATTTHGIGMFGTSRGISGAAASSSLSSSSKPPPPSSAVRALAWDPTGTASLSICPLPGKGRNGGGGGNKDEFDLDVFLSHDATGCPEEETECLLRCLDAREEWMATLQQRSRQRMRRGGVNAGGEGVTKLSMDYRAALCECLVKLQDKAQDDNNDEDGQMKDDGAQDGNNLELLSLTYAISHLAEIFLLPSSAPESHSGAPAYHSDNADGELSRLDGPAGSLTADAARYLRLHHSGEVSSSILDAPEVAEMLESDQPEYYRFPSASSDGDIIPGPHDHPYWNLLLRFVVCGQLSDAWTLLSHHSACRRAQEEAEDMAMNGEEEELSPEGRGFAALRAILLSAPLPGGRGDGYCDDAGLDDFLEEESLLEGEEVGGNDEAEDDDAEAEDPGDIDQLLIDGVAPNAYLLWEALPRRADQLRALRYRRDLRRCGRACDVPEESSESPAVPQAYQPRVAMNAHQTWQETIRVTAFPAGLQGNDNGVLSALFRRFPPLQQMVSILVGVVPPAIANANCLTWSEVLLMELLYSRPNIMPEDIAVRANAAMSKVGGDGSGGRPLEEIILSIMNGSAGQVVETMFSLCGGSSGAALPAAMTSLLCNLLVDAGRISPRRELSRVDIQTELLVLAAESVISSFSVQGQCDVGVRTAVRLLLPHAPPKRASRPLAESNDVEESSAEEEDAIYEPRIAAMISEALSHRLPATDAEARDLLQLCEDAIRLGSVHIADACELLAFSRSSHHGSSGNSTREAYWLLRGMEVQTCWLPSDRRRNLGFASRRRFDLMCEGAANDLISRLSSAAVANNLAKGMVEEEEKEMALVLRAAENVLEGVLQDEVMAPVLLGHVESNLLKYAVEIAVADANGDTVEVAADIVHCLEERCMSEGNYGGVVSTLADPKMYTEFLNIAFAILAKEETASQEGPMEFAECAFTVHGMHILMARLTQVLSWEGVISASQGSPSKQQPSGARKEYFGAMRLAFCKGLMRIMCCKNAPMKKGGKEKDCEVPLEEEINLLLGPRI